MILVALAAFFIAALILVLSFLASKNTAKKLRGASYMIANDLCYTLMVFLTPNILTAIFIEIKEGIILDWSVPWSKGFMILAILMLIFAHFLSTYTAHKNSDVGKFLKKKEKTAIHMPFIFNIRLILIIILLFVYHVSPSAPTYLCLTLLIGYILFIIFCRPHLMKFDLLRSLCIEGGLLCIFLMRILPTSEFL